MPEVRVFTGRTSIGVRGIALAEGDKVISMSILRHVEATSEERVAYLKRASAVRRGMAEEEAPVHDERRRTPRTAGAAIELGEKRYVELSAAEQFVLTIPSAASASVPRRSSTAPRAAAAKASSP